MVRGRWRLISWGRAWSLRDSSRNARAGSPWATSASRAAVRVSRWARSGKSAGRKRELSDLRHRGRGLDLHLGVRPVGQADEGILEDARGLGADRLGEGQAGLRALGLEERLERGLRFVRDPSARDEAGQGGGTNEGARVVAGRAQERLVASGPGPGPQGGRANLGVTMREQPGGDGQEIGAVSGLVEDLEGPQHHGARRVVEDQGRDQPRPALVREEVHGRDHLPVVARC